LKACLEPHVGTLGFVPAISRYLEILGPILANHTLLQEASYNW